MTFFEQREFTMEVIRKLDERLNEIRDTYEKEWKKIGEEQRYKWNDKNEKELLWLDEEKTVPDMRDVYENVKKEELSNDDKAHTEILSVLAKELKYLTYKDFYPKWCDSVEPKYGPEANAFDFMAGLH